MEGAVEDEVEEEEVEEEEGDDEDDAGKVLANLRK
jgi:hypothetical protein